MEFSKIKTNYSGSNNYMGPQRFGEKFERDADQAALGLIDGSPSRTSPGDKREDFSRVVVHLDPKAAHSAQSIGARAYTSGHPVVFGPGEYMPHSTAGKMLLAHELAHVIQQRNMSPPGGTIQRKGASFSGFFSNIGRAISGIFGGNPRFDETTLNEYLREINESRDIQGDFNSDDKAREIVNIWKEGGDGFDLRDARIKSILIREMLSGFTGDDDEEAILELLERSENGDLRIIFQTISPGLLNSNFHGDEETRLQNFYERRFEGGIGAISRGNINPIGNAIPLGVDLPRRAEIRAAGTPYDRMMVDRARRTLPMLYRFVDEWTARQMRQEATKRELTPLREGRQRMEKSSSDPFSELRPRIEAQNIARLNRNPLNIELYEDQIIFRINFHIRFENPAMSSRFGDLRSSLQQGIEMVWNQRWSGALLGNRNFIIEPQITQISSTAARDRNYWLITVRQTDNDPIAYPGCTLPQSVPGVPTSATDPMCDGGVMSIPPRHITMPGILGHELLHLFGLIDRYMMMTEQMPDGTNRVTTSPTRDTRGRQDPLGTQEGRILEEDLAFIFEHLGLYSMEESRGLETLKRLEQEGLSIGLVIGEINHLEDVIRLGYDPRSLIRPRTDFNQQMIRDAERL